MSNIDSVLHLTIGRFFKNLFKTRDDYELVMDRACGGNQRIPLFYLPEKSRESEYCNVDLMVLKRNKIRIIVEIEESNKKPTQVCGKFLTSALAQYYIHKSKNDEPIEMDDSVVFIQIVGTSKLAKDKTQKFKQWKALEESISKITPLKNSRITEYRLFNADQLDELSSFIRKIT
jgi:hypothetical protein